MIRAPPPSRIHKTWSNMKLLPVDGGEVVFNPFNRRNYRDRYSDRPVPKVPTHKDSPRFTGDLKFTLKYLNDTAGDSDDFVTKRIDIREREAFVDGPSDFMLVQHHCSDGFRILRRHTGCHSNPVSRREPQIVRHFLS